MPAETKLIEVPSDAQLIEVGPELWSKHWVYIAEDCRMQLLIVSQRLHCIAEAIDQLCNQFVSVSSLSESATCRLKGRTAGSWRVHRVTHADAPSLVPLSAAATASPSARASCGGTALPSSMNARDQTGSNSHSRGKV